MAHYAFLDENNIVLQVIVGKDENEDGVDWEIRYSEIKGMRCKRTSYNTVGNSHNKGGTPFRKNFAGIGYLYDESKDAFIPPKPYESWTLNDETCLWNPPFPPPVNNGRYNWDEKNKVWEELP